MNEIREFVLVFYACVQFFSNNFNRGILKSVVSNTQCIHFNNDFLGTRTSQELRMLSRSLSVY